MKGLVRTAVAIVCVVSASRLRQIHSVAGAQQVAVRKMVRGREVADC